MVALSTSQNFPAPEQPQPSPWPAPEQFDGRIEDGTGLGETASNLQVLLKLIAALLSNAESLRFWPDRTAPGAPVNVSPCWGWICENSLVPSVCTPGANQYVVFGLRDESAKLALFPAGTVTAPAGAEDGPFSIEELPQICAGGSSGAEPGGGGGVGEDVPV